jgi:hypothetical protein
MTAVRIPTAAAVAVCAALWIAVAPPAPWGSRAAAAVTVNGNARAWHELLAAFGRLNRLRGYRIKVDAASGTMVVDVMPRRNAVHSTMQSQGMDAEVIVVGSHSRSRLTAPGVSGTWACEGVPPLPKASDFLGADGTVDVARAPDTAIDGEAVRVYRVAASGSFGEITSTVFVGAANGLPRRAVMTSGAGEQTLDYYDYGAPIEITLPPC